MQKTKRITMSSVAAVAAALIAAPAAWSWGGLTLPAPMPSAPSGNAMPLTASAGQPGAPGGLIQMGQPSPGDVGKAGYGHGVPLSLALGMLVPPTWVSSTDGVSPSALVSWREGQSWPQALDQVAKTNGWTIVLDWTGHTVTVEGGLAAQAAGGGVAVAHKAERPVAVENKEPVVPVAPVAKEVVLLPGKSLSKQMVDQGRDHGWSVIWKLQHDWIVPNKAAFSSDFPKAVQEIVRDLAANGADIGADVYQGNRTVVVHSGISK